MRVPLVVHVNGEKKTIGSAVVEAPASPNSPVVVTATVNDVEVAKAIQGSSLKGLSIAPQSTSNEFHTEGTMQKVYESLRRAGVNRVMAEDAVNEMQNHGILFRERS
jgi:hypothetical protein